MRCFVYIDFSLAADGRAVGFATGRPELLAEPVVGKHLTIGLESNGVEDERAKHGFLITGVVPADKNIDGNEDLSWLVTCDDNFFATLEEIQQTVTYLENHGFVFDGFYSDV